MESVPPHPWIDPRTVERQMHPQTARWLDAVVRSAQESVQITLVGQALGYPVDADYAWQMKNGWYLQ